MAILKYQKLLRSQLRLKAYFSTSITDSEYTATPKYPPILDLSFKKKKEREKLAGHEVIKSVKTVEEKLIKLNMPRYYGFSSHILTEDYIPYNNLELIQYITRTHLIEQTDLPKYYENIGVNNTALIGLKEELIEALLFEIERHREIHDLKEQDLLPSEKENVIGNSIIRQLNRVITNKLSREYKHLKNCQLDYEPRIESSWYCGGIQPTERVKNCRRGLKWMESMIDDPVDRLMTYTGSPYLTLRSEKPLPFIVTTDEAENPDLDVPVWKYDPRVVGIHTELRRIVNIPGFWPGDKHTFGLLQFLKRGHMLDRPYGDLEDDKKALHRQGILASFAWLNAQASYLGFTTFNDITYPIVTQTIITNGQIFSFYTYQMNTMLLHSENATENNKKNICWSNANLKLYDDIVDGKLQGFNEEVLSKLVKYYANTPSERLGVNLTPYLSSSEKLAADYEDAEKREWLEREYKFLTSNRPRQHLMYEVYDWEKIYKIDHKTKFMDKKLRPFELRQQPWKRTLDDRKPKYIPRVLRPDLPKNKGRNAKEFFP